MTTWYVTEKTPITGANVEWAASNSCSRKNYYSSDFEFERMVNADFVASDLSQLKTAWAVVE